MKRIIIIILTVFQLLSLTACGKSQEGANHQEIEKENIEVKDITHEEQQSAYAIKNSEEDMSLKAMAYDIFENKIYYCVSCFDRGDGENFIYTMELWRMNMDFGEKTLLTEIDTTDSRVYGMCLRDNGNILLLTSESDLDAGGGFSVDEYSNSGEFICDYTLKDIASDLMPMNMMYSDGMCFLTDVGVLYAVRLEERAELLYSVKIGRSVPGFTILKDGRGILNCRDENKTRLQIINTADGSIEGEKTFDISFLSADGGLSHDLYLDDGLALYSYDIGSKAPEKLFSWNSIGIMGGRIKEVEEKVFICNGGLSSNDRGHLLILKEELLPEGANPHTLLLATVSGEAYVSRLKDRVNAWNRSHPFCKIEMRDYSMYGDEANPLGAQLQMAKDVASGIIPDIYDFTPSQYTGMSAMNPAPLAKRGMLEDLNPYIDADPEIRRENLFDNLLKAAEIDGGLYEIFGEFVFCSAYGPADVIGGSEKWNFESLKTIAGENGFLSIVGSDWSDKAALLNTLLLRSGTKLVDWTAGECYFDSEYFLNILHELTVPFADTIPDTPYYDERVKARSGLLQLDSNGSMWCCTPANVYGTNFDFMGLPEIGNAVYPNASYGISSSSKYKDECWQFLRPLIIPSKEKAYAGIHIDRTYTESLIPRELNEAKEEGYIDHHPYIEPAMNKLLVAIENTEVIMRPDTQILEIVSSEVEEFLAGVRSAEEAAANIQSRVSIYMSEQG